jgi:hypothetical protein
MQTTIISSLISFGGGHRVSDFGEQNSRLRNLFLVSCGILFLGRVRAMGMALHQTCLD